MTSLGALSFASPMILIGLAALPIIWWILRLTPPAPRRERFPALVLLLGLVRRDETPAHTPLWLLILRLLIAALLILGLAGPVLNARPAPAGSGRLAIVIDTGWTAAANWPAIEAAALEAIEGAQGSGRPVILVRTTSAVPQGFQPTTAQRARGLVQALEPSPWPAEPASVLAAWRADMTDATRPDEILWLSDGISGRESRAFAAGLAEIAPLKVLVPTPEDLPLGLRPPRAEADAIAVDVVRASAEARGRGALVAIGENGRVISRADFEFEIGGPLATARFRLPIEVRNEIVRIEIDRGRTAGGTALIDERLRRRSVGLVSGGAIESAQPLLSDLYYAERALEPFADLKSGSIAELVDKGVQIIVVADVGRIVGDDLTAATRFVEGGGLLVRFAGSRLASQSDDLVPVALRQGGRAIGGALSWSTPQTLQAFEDGSPFEGLEVRGDVTVSRQVLAEPAPELAQHTWARLSDGTPLVTAAKRGEGTIVLFHVTANTDWSNLPLSGLFVEMLERLLTLSRGPGAAQGLQVAATSTLAPRKTLDATGRLGDPPGTARPLTLAELAEGRVNAVHPPGLYGPLKGARALNTLGRDDTLAMLDLTASGIQPTAYAADPQRRLGPHLLVMSFLLALADALAALFLLGKISLPRRAGAAALTLLALSSGWSFVDTAHASDQFLIEGVRDTRLAYVITGNSQVDRLSRLGLEGLSRRLAAKTALEPGTPIGLDIETAELALFPLIYWPITEDATALTPAAQSKLDRYLKTGGMILFDTRDGDTQGAALGATGTQAALRLILSGLDVPPLEPLHDRHVLTRSFYILKEFPGRFATGRVWVEAGDDLPAEDGGTTNDGVSSIVIGSNDWAAAWAVDESGRGLVATMPGGEGQREWAYRFGINLAMYALTGNYKGDEVHTRALIERLGE